MSIISRIKRHGKLSKMAASYQKNRTPPFLTVFINSVCNLTCEHCFYWKNLNQRNDLTLEEFEKLSNELGDFENLNLSGGEPFIRDTFAEICLLFAANNNVQNIYVPTNGYFTDKTEKSIRKVLRNASLKLFVCELSLDGMPEYHNRFRGNPRSFEKAMETYAMLARLQKEDPRLKIHASTVAMSENMEQINQLSDYLYENCPEMEHLNLAVIRGERKNPSLQGPQLERYKKLYKDISNTWRSREKRRFGSSVEPMLQWAKVKTIKSESQVIPCTAGNLSGVVYANGDVSVCETHRPLGNLRKNSFFEIWDSAEARKLREQIKAKNCYCTGEISMWSSIVFQPVQLTRAMVGAKISEIGSKNKKFETI